MKHEISESADEKVAEVSQVRKEVDNEWVKLQEKKPSGKMIMPPNDN